MMANSSWDTLEEMTEALPKEWRADTLLTICKPHENSSSNCNVANRAMPRAVQHQNHMLDIARLTSENDKRTIMGHL